MTFPLRLRGFFSLVPAAAPKPRLVDKTTPRPFSFPLRRPTRIALLDTDFLAGPGMCHFDAESFHRLEAWEPEALVVPLNLALMLGDQKRRGFLDIPSVNTAIVVLTSIEDSPLADHYRDLLWRAFGVPLFEQLLGTDGSVIASECEVHNGLHLHRAGLPIAGEVITDPCPCGAETPRIRRAPARRAKAAAAVG